MGQQVCGSIPATLYPSLRRPVLGPVRCFPAAITNIARSSYLETERFVTVSVRRGDSHRRSECVQPDGDLSIAVELVSVVLGFHQAPIFVRLTKQVQPQCAQPGLRIDKSRRMANCLAPVERKCTIGGVRPRRLIPLGESPAPVCPHSPLTRRLFSLLAAIINAREL